jgi:hypothetical protein
MTRHYRRLRRGSVGTGSAGIALASDIELTLEKIEMLLNILIIYIEAAA